jgi:hypothetical protein
MRSTLGFLSILACFSLAGVACKNDGADHAVICTQAKIRRVNADKGTPNDRQQRCHGMTQKHILTAPNADHAAYADCVLEAESEAAAAQCK